MDPLEAAVSRMVRELAPSSNKAKALSEAKDRAFRKCNYIAEKMQRPMSGPERFRQEHRLQEALDELRRLSE